MWVFGFCDSSFASHTFNILICPLGCWPLSPDFRGPGKSLFLPRTFLPIQVWQSTFALNFMALGLCHFFVICHLLPHCQCIVWNVSCFTQICSSARISYHGEWLNSTPSRCSSTNWPSSVTLPSLLNNKYEVLCHLNISVPCHFLTAFLALGLITLSQITATTFHNWSNSSTASHWIHSPSCSQIFAKCK